MDSSYSVRYVSEKLTLNKYGDSTDRIGKTLFNAKISLNPHQIQAALFAFSSPASKGVMLCDEVGLGKTIEAGIVISQYWCERKRNILIFTPAALTRQWANELEDKFNLQSIVIDRKYYNSQIKRGIVNPFEGKNKVIILSINFASLMAEEISKSKIDLVVIDEAHKLRNVYNINNIMLNSIKNAISNFKKILLTATPLQNNLMELYGLSTIIDESIFGDKEYFKKHYINDYDENRNELRERLTVFIHRTLRKQVTKYVKYSRRITETFKFTPSKEEDELYVKLTELIQSNPSFGVKNGQNWLISLILRKLLSSSTSAVKYTLIGIKDRLTNILSGNSRKNISSILEDEDEDFDEDFEDEDEHIDVSKIKSELDKVEGCLTIANSIKNDKKAYRLLEAIEFLFSNVTEDRNKKILIFTESRKTQDYLFAFLQNNGYSNVVLFNGGYTDPKTQEIYEKWINDSENQKANQNSRRTNIRSAILDYFQNKADIMIATEAGAEGLNIQFCSMLINYDLPWNPQRVEQRIGRCHRFGQKNDVLVINFLNDHNQIDSRIYELLADKFKLFDNVFGSSDEVLGKLDSESNFERAIFDIYTSCRTPKEIDAAFNELQSKFKIDITIEMKKTREILIDNFDEDLQNVFDSLMINTELQLKEIEFYFFRLCRFTFTNKASFDKYGFILREPFLDFLPGKYIIADKEKNHINLRLDDEKGNEIIAYCSNQILKGSIAFDITNYKFQISELKKIKGKKGTLIFGKVNIESFENEDHILLSGMLEDGTYIPPETCEKLFRLSSRNIDEIFIENEIVESNNKNFDIQVSSVLNYSLERNNKILQEEIKKIDDWANDKIAGIQLKVETLRERRKDLQKEADYSINITEKASIELEINRISKQIRSSWLDLADSEDEVELKRKQVVEKLRKESMRKVTTTKIFSANFEVI